MSKEQETDPRTARYGGTVDQNRSFKFSAGQLPATGEGLALDADALLAKEWLRDLDEINHSERKDFIGNANFRSRVMSIVHNKRRLEEGK